MKTTELTGVQPVGLSLTTLRKLGRYPRVGQKDLVEGDIILYQESAFCVVRKPSQLYRGAPITLRELVTNDVKTVRIESRLKLPRLVMPQVFQGDQNGRWESWRLSPGDVVLYPGPEPDRAVLAIRHSRGWFRTAPPWTPLADAEVIHDVVEDRALMVRSGDRRARSNPGAEFVVSSVVATRDRTQVEPSVWFRQSEDYWVGNSRQSALSDQMIRFELERGTYQVLRLPEVSWPTT